jgi:hypothetical protein
MNIFFELIYIYSEIKLKFNYEFYYSKSFSQQNKKHSFSVLLRIKLGIGGYLFCIVFI